MARIVIVDDHPSTRDGLMTRIELENDLEVCGEAADVDEAFQLIQRLAPDIAIIDVSLKTSNGIELIKLVKSAKLTTRMLVWSMYEDSLYAERALRAGAMGYINKENVTGVIIDAIRKVLKGDVFLSAEMSSRMLNRVVMGKEASGSSPSDALSDRELQTFSLIGHGMKTADIAEEMGLSVKTVETYRARIKEKLELDDLAALAREAVQWVIENG
ncbi:response regulator transcription factor [Novipirellula artificiosorum]|uniref:Oxygen regulatory protein NreC n=1 Tax=Novipirellula artificiosorum TaxID=2528016 RepID=A0A5C6DYC7_9BACT|nr:response regulator transcription factor [Novipirellula artificiosorum]TWU42443.1 Oxygen regulatory protein NreC [Novipirellula artificiosorum]